MNLLKKYEKNYRIPSGSPKGPIKQDLSALLTFYLSRRFLGIVSLIFLKFCHDARIACEVRSDRARFSGKIIFAPKIGKKGFFQLIGKFGHQFLLNLIYNKNLYYWLCSCTGCIYVKIFVPEIWVRMFSANQIPGFFNQPYPQNKSVKQSDSLPC